MITYQDFFLFCTFIVALIRFLGEKIAAATSIATAGLTRG